MLSCVNISQAVWILNSSDIWMPWNLHSRAHQYLHPLSDAGEASIQELTFTNVL